MSAYNAGLYIAQAIESVLTQTMSDFEFLIIDDGSTDNTLDIIRSYKDKRITLISRPNKGLIASLNEGLEVARGKYIARFDADDVCYPSRLALQYSFLSSHPEYVLCGTAADYIDKDGEDLFEWQPAGYTSEDIAAVITSECPFDHPTVMYVKDVALKIGGYPDGAIHFEDHLFWTHFFDHGKVINLPQPLIKHRFNPGSVTIDEKWRGPKFAEIKYRSISNRSMSDQDKKDLKDILEKQDVKKYKEAAYYSMIGKKYLWNKYDPAKARKNLAKAISIMPLKSEPYLLYVLSLFPQGLISSLYKRVKK